MSNRILPILFATLSFVALPLASPVQAALTPAGTDRFGRAVVAGWGEADAGGPWSAVGERAALAVGRGVGLVTLAEAGAGRGARQASIVAQDVELTGLVSVDRLPAGGNAFAYLVGRWRDEDEIRLKMRVDPAGAVFLQATNVADGEEIGIGDEVPIPALLTPGVALAIRGQIVGADPVSVRMRAWLAGTPEPSTWPVQGAATGAGLVRTGGVGVRTYVGSSVTDAPLTFAFDDWSATVLDAPTTPVESPSPSPSAGPATPAPTSAPDVVPAGTVIATDELARTTERGWGTAPVGGAWSHAGQRDAFRVDGRRGLMAAEPGETRSAELTGALARDVQLLLTVRPAALPLDGNAWLYVVLRRTEEAEVRGRVRIAPDGSVHLGISVDRDGTETTLGPEIRTGDLSTSPERPIRVRFQGVGAVPTTWSIKAWASGAAEPEGWALEVVDASPELQGPGSIAVRAYLGKTVSASVTLEVDDLTARTVTGTETDPVLVGAGDVAACDSRGAEQTATLLDGIPGTVFAAGDLAYPDGTAKQFTQCFGPTWGRHQDRMLPALGNRDYGTPGAAGWFATFDAALVGPGWYAVDIGSWRVYVLDAECDQVGCGEGSAQLSWLRSDLVANPRACSLAIWHDPRFTSGPHGDTTAVVPFWDALHAAGAELVISGHDHAYERLRPMGPTGGLDTDQGMVQFIAGTGGGGGTAFGSIRANSAVHDGATFGVLKLTLRAESWDWQFVPVPGSPFTDSGSARCHGAP